MKKITNQQVFTYTCLFMLLAGRILDTSNVSNFLQLFHVAVPPNSSIFGIRLTLNWIYTLFFNWSFILVGMVIVVNRNDLQSLNIDIGFAAIFVAGSLTYWKYYRWPSGWIALLMPLVMYILYKKRVFRFAKIEERAGIIIIIVTIIFFLGLLFIRDSLTINRFLTITHLIATLTPLMLIEEILFRGLLWKFLTDLSWSVPKTVGLQAFLFWISHFSILFTNPLIFWIILPAFSIISGILVWRTKSITPSLIAHIFYNFYSEI